MTSSVLHRSLLYAGFMPDEKPLPIPGAVDLEGELGALGEGPFRTLTGGIKSSLNSPWRSPELNLLLRKFIPEEKLSRKFVKDDMILLVWWAVGRKEYHTGKVFHKLLGSAAVVCYQRLVTSFIGNPETENYQIIKRFCTIICYNLVDYLEIFNRLF